MDSGSFRVDTFLAGRPRNQYLLLAALPLFQSPSRSKILRVIPFSNSSTLVITGFQLRHNLHGVEFAVDFDRSLCIAFRVRSGIDLLSNSRRKKLETSSLSAYFLPTVAFIPWPVADINPKLTSSQYLFDWAFEMVEIHRLLSSFSK